MKAYLRLFFSKPKVRLRVLQIAGVRTGQQRVSRIWPEGQCLAELLDFSCSDPRHVRHHVKVPPYAMDSPRCNHKIVTGAARAAKQIRHAPDLAGCHQSAGQDIQNSGRCPGAYPGRVMQNAWVTDQRCHYGCGPSCCAFGR